eukprot:1144845-Pelagomonas_calceolata.AAC.1
MPKTFATRQRHTDHAKSTRERCQTFCVGSNQEHADGPGACEPGQNHTDRDESTGTGSVPLPVRGERMRVRQCMGRLATCTWREWVALAVTFIHAPPHPTMKAILHLTSASKTNADFYRTPQRSNSCDKRYQAQAHYFTFHQSSTILHNAIN